MPTRALTPLTVALRVAVVLTTTAGLLLACERKVATPGHGEGPPSAETMPSPAAELGRPVEITLGQTARVGPDRLEVTFVAVPEDSRCPEGVSCVWAGRAAVDVKATAPGAEPASLHLTTDRGAEAAAYGPYTVTLVGLAPRPRRDGPPRPADYVVTLVVTRT